MFSSARSRSFFSDLNCCDLAVFQPSFFLTQIPLMWWFPLIPENEINFKKICNSPRA